ncbi:hypothetical protein BC673_12837 [Prevotella pallens]|uniref:Arm DNA-binding domain-containing protein n=1 Tax=Prevotella pallens TaxID=60133 RepID=A0ABX9DNF2_9BACT|nr:hypothetical protein BC673_12837 [Prevotella pallens]
MIYIYQFNGRTKSISYRKRGILLTFTKKGPNRNYDKDLSPIL